MNTPNPLVPHGSLQSRGKSTVRTAFFTIAAIHIVFIGGLLIQGGCKKSEDAVAVPEDQAPPELPPMDVTDTAPTNYEVPVVTNDPFQTAPPVVDTAPPVVDIAPPPTFATGTAAREYVVVKGDSFSSIAQKMNTSVRAIEQANPGVNPLRLQIGQRLQIPASTTSTSSASATPSSNGNGNTYTVKSGDVLEKIARNNNTTIKEIMRLNNLQTTMIKVGQKLKLPSTNSATSSQGYVTPLPPTQ